MLGHSNVSFYMYSSDQFMEYSRKYLKRTVDQKAIDEIREIRKEYEESFISRILTLDKSDFGKEYLSDYSFFLKEKAAPENMDELKRKRELLEKYLIDIKNVINNLNEIIKKCTEIDDLNNYFLNLRHLQAQYSKLKSEIEKIDNKLNEINIMTSMIRSNEHV
jgi:valyl-tRNA synthetase